MDVLISNLKETIRLFHYRETLAIYKIYNYKVNQSVND